MQPAEGPRPWRFSTLLAAPHRLSFFTAACVMSAAALWWWVEMLARSGAWPSLATAVPSTFVHPVVMSLGFMPLFFSGFLFTAGPKWLQMGEVQARAIAPGVLTTGAGWLALLCG
ncbi:NnrS family protein, partial [Aquabacterium sp.]|uniref:NnrS family protein n=1 Tax=Aquabacterium sp. TaxID=1872578 RepID=UPI0025BAE9A8